MTSPKRRQELPRCEECARTFETCRCTSRYAAKNPKVTEPRLPINKSEIVRRTSDA